MAYKCDSFIVFLFINVVQLLHVKSKMVCLIIVRGFFLFVCLFNCEIFVSQLRDHEYYIFLNLFS